MLKRKHVTDDIIPKRTKVVCVECGTFDWDECTKVDIVQGTVVCTLCGLELNSHLLYEVLEGDRRSTFDEEPKFSMQSFFQSHMRGGSRMLQVINSRVEKDLRCEDGKTSEHYKNAQRTISTNCWVNGVISSGSIV